MRSQSAYDRVVQRQKRNFLNLTCSRSLYTLPVRAPCLLNAAQVGAILSLRSLSYCRYSQLCVHSNLLCCVAGSGAVCLQLQQKQHQDNNCQVGARVHCTPRFYGSLLEKEEEKKMKSKWDQNAFWQNTDKTHKAPLENHLSKLSNLSTVHSPPGWRHLSLLRK